MTTKITLDLRQQTAVVECETSIEAAVFLAAVQGARPTAQQAVQILTAPESAAPAELPAPKRQPRKPAQRAEAAPETSVAPTETAPPVEPAPPTQRSEKPAGGIVWHELPPVEMRGHKVFGAGRAVIAAFRMSESYPLAKLAQHIYGNGGASRVLTLRKLLSVMVGNGTLRRLGNDSYCVVEENAR
jgi:hypothetical protein